MGSRSKLAGSLALLLVLLPPSLARAQTIDLGGSTQGMGHRQHVELLSDVVEIPSGHTAWVDLRFRVDPGMHINSHEPHDETLIPTRLEVDAQPAVKVLEQRYPTGLPLRLDVGSGETLSTYQGEFVVRLQLASSATEGTLSGVLHYQACDARSCFPPRSLPVHVRLVRGNAR